MANVRQRIVRFLAWTAAAVVTLAVALATVRPHEQATNRQSNQSIGTD